MTPEQQQAFEEKLYAYVGRQACPRTPAKDPVNAAMIRHWTEVMGDTNPAYTDSDWAAGSRRGHTIAPPAMLYVWNQEGYPVVSRGRARDPQTEMVEMFNDYGFTGVLGTNVTQEYQRELRPGDTVYVEMVIDTISERKSTARGEGYFFETLATFTNQDEEVIGTQRFRVLKFIPREEPAAAGESKDALAVPTRIPAPRGHDNAWWWEAVDEGKVLIQRCSDCQTLRHPPRPMCGECQSMAWDAVESSLEGEVLSYTCVRHPRVPGYPADPICAVIRLAEGTNLIANVVGCDYEDVSIGMKVTGKVEQVDDKTALPQFYPA